MSRAELGLEYFEIKNSAPVISSQGSGYEQCRLGFLAQQQKAKSEQISRHCEGKRSFDAAIQENYVALLNDDAHADEILKRVQDDVTANDGSCDAPYYSPLTTHFSLKKAFTLAEVLITLGIIGIVAALVIPAVIQKSQDAEFKTGKDEVRMSIAEAGRVLSVTDNIAYASSAEDFVKNYLSKQLKIAKYCAPADMEQCGMPSGNPTTFKNLYGANVDSMPTKWTLITSSYGVTGDVPADNSSAPSSTEPTTTNFNSSYAFLAGNGIAVNLFYNPNCATSFQDKPYYNSSSYTYTDIRPQYSRDTACMAGVYDMNGLKKPNQVGRDIGFFGVFYNGLYSTSAASLPYKEGIDTNSDDWTTANNYCQGFKGWKLPTVDELSALYLGRNITGIPSSAWLWSASPLPGSSGAARVVGFSSGNRSWNVRSYQYAVRCVRD